MLPESGEQETENRMSSLEIAFDLRERLLRCFYFDYRQDLATDTADKDQLFPAKLHPYAFDFRDLAPSVNKMSLKSVESKFKSKFIHEFCHESICCLSTVKTSVSRSFLFSKWGNDWVGCHRHVWSFAFLSGFISDRDKEAEKKSLEWGCVLWGPWMSMQ